jgi:hypothetical protein
VSPLDCSRPLDPADAEALATGAVPVFAADAASHASSCASCGSAVQKTARLLETLEMLTVPTAGPHGLKDPVRVLPADLTARILKLRPFSRAERRNLRLWAGPLLLAVGVFAGGVLLLAPGLTSADRAGLGAGVMAALVGVLRSLPAWASDLSGVAPEGLDALASALRGEVSLGLAALLLGLPAALGLKRALARARRRR